MVTDDYCKTFTNYRDGTGVSKYLVFKNDKIVVLLALQSDRVDSWECDLGIDKCKMVAREVGFWTCMSAQMAGSSFLTFISCNCKFL